MLKRIKELKKQHNAVIIAHHYAPIETHEISDYLSDSYGFFTDIKTIGKRDDIDIVIVLAPTFFAEMAVAMIPNKKVIMPLLSDCPIASHSNLSFDKIFQFIEQYPNLPFVCYGTSPLPIKLLADYITIPGRVVETIESIGVPQVLFAGESNCADEAVEHLGDRIINYPYNPTCNVYNSAVVADVTKAREEHKDCMVLVHPECKPEVTEVADRVMGTGDMLTLIKENGNSVDTYVLGTEEGFYERAKKEFPEKNIVHLTSKLLCNTFKVFRLEVIASSLEDIESAPRIELNQAVADKIRILFEEFFNQYKVPLTISDSQRDLNVKSQSQNRELELTY